MKHCLVLSAPEEIYRCPERESPAEAFLILYTQLILSEIHKNGYAFSFPLRCPCELILGLNLAGTKFLDKTIHLTHLHTFQFYDLFTNVLQYEDFLYISDSCDHHCLLKGHSDTKITKSFCDYCRGETDLLFVVHPAGHLDDQTAAILASAQKKKIPIFRYHPETFETVRENLPPDWIIPEGDYSEKDIWENIPKETKVK